MYLGKLSQALTSSLCIDSWSFVLVLRPCHHIFLVVAIDILLMLCAKAISVLGSDDYPSPSWVGNTAVLAGALRNGGLLLSPHCHPLGWPPPYQHRTVHFSEYHLLLDFWSTSSHLWGHLSSRKLIMLLNASLCWHRPLGPLFCLLGRSSSPHLCCALASGPT